ncbi:MAG: precorrin-6Y C5,15-methyltransferase (decarboxylating) subunit CbiT [Candidatus Atribacteria bacterium]|nr:precorrin-6Y C5,15-methyltransferase (decarboxylating) subunit CbiT [Candidatus Atribacteria bacterium]
MTKEEVRAISLSKLRLKKNSTVWDIGSGTGSVSVESALYCSEGLVYAVERNEKALELLRQNAKMFGTNNLVPIQGQAPEILFRLPTPDRVFIGGSGGKIKEILEIVRQNLRVGGVIVINAIILETICQAQDFFSTGGFEVEMIYVNIAKSSKVGSSAMLLAGNPVFIISATC